jgi:hypothetical protein
MFLFLQRLLAGEQSAALAGAMTTATLSPKLRQAKERESAISSLEDKSSWAVSNRTAGGSLPFNQTAF